MTALRGFARLSFRRRRRPDGTTSSGESSSAVLALNGAAAGELRAAERAGKQLGRLAARVAVDGGLDAWRASGRRPDWFVGDGDSVRGAIDAREIERLPRDKDVSDLGAALRTCSRRAIDVVVVAGLVGGRLDHEWANLFELGAQARHFDGMLAPTARGTVVVTAYGCRTPTVRNRHVTLLSLTASSRIRVAGTRWELHDRPLRSGSHGLSNITGRELDLVVQSGVVALVFPPGAEDAP